MELNDMRALVTGGSEGIGRGIAAALRREGCRVAITGRRAGLLEKTAAELGVGFLQGDVGDEADAVRTVAAFVEEFGGIDILVNNAGFGSFAPLLETTFADLEAVYRTNVFGAFLMAREAAKHFVRQGSGHLVNIASTAGLKGFQRGTAYASSKFALRGMTECWRDELRRHNVRVILVNPSEVQTPFFSKLGMEQQTDPRKLRPDDVADAVVGALKMDPRGFIPELSVWATNPW